ncbi:hypothetical protein L13192_03541 [Pyrenophora tritici-repentis]|nr:hypothetical protein PtrSN001C_005901 [Pyrenophora tritici-repentis]KAI1672682.1 hypothetical protein L13192_03541 [Pyrenophora tritici-repentis]
MESGSGRPDSLTEELIPVRVTRGEAKKKAIKKDAEVEVKKEKKTMEVLIASTREDYEATESQDGDMEDGGEFGEETDGIVVDEEVCGRGGRGQGRSNPPEAAGSRQDHWKEKVEREGQG